MESLIGKTLQDGKYTLRQELGRGGFGITYVARHRYLDQDVVIKTINPGFYQHPEFAEFQRKFQDEARRLALCLHPHIVRVSDFFTEAGFPYMVMEYVPGPTLDQVIFPNRPLPEATAIAYIRQVGDALRVVHQRGLLHRDIKPHNIILRDGTQQVVLIDFGIAREFTAGVTQAHTSLASEGYAPIEQYLPREKRTAATDIYGLAATLYALVTAQNPVASLLRDRQPLPEPLDLQPQLSRATNQAILRGMAQDMHHRPQSVEEWLALLPERQTAVVPMPPPPPRTAATVAVAPPPRSSPKPPARTAPPPPQPTPVNPAPNRTPFPWLWMGAGVGTVAAIALALFLGQRSPVPEPVVRSTPLSAAVSPSPVEEETPPPAPEPTPSPEPPPSPAPSEAPPQEPAPPPPGDAPGIPTGTTVDALQAALGEPTQISSGAWGDTRAFLYREVAGETDMGFLVDRGSGRIQQTEVSFAQSADLAVIQSTLSGMLGGGSGEVDQGLAQVYEGQSNEYSFATGGLEGVIQRNEQGRIYIGVWEAGLH